MDYSTLGQFGTWIIWHLVNKTLGKFGTQIFWHVENKALGQFEPEQFDTLALWHFGTWSIWHLENKTLIQFDTWTHWHLENKTLGWFGTWQFDTWTIRHLYNLTLGQFETWTIWHLDYLWLLNYDNFSWYVLNKKFKSAACHLVVKSGGDMPLFWLTRNEKRLLIPILMTIPGPIVINLFTAVIYECS